MAPISDPTAPPDPSKTSSVAPPGVPPPVVPADTPSGASIPPGRLENASYWSHWQLLVLATGGATIGFLTGMGIWSEIRANSVDFALWAICLGLAAWVLFDPGMDLLYDWLGAPRSEFPEGRKKAATVVAALATLLVSAFHHSLDVILGKEFDLGHWLGFKTGGLGLALLVFVGVVLAPSFVTHWWVRGVQRKPLRAATYGAITSLSVGVVAVLLLLQYRQLLPSPWLGIPVVLLGLLWFVGPGILGGLAINKCPCDSTSVTGTAPSPTRDILWNLAFFSAGYVGLLLALAHIFAVLFPAYKENEGYVWLLVAALIFQNLGWALALFFRKKSCDRHLGLSGTLIDTPIDTPPQGPKGGVLQTREPMSCHLEEASRACRCSGQ